MKIKNYEEVIALVKKGELKYPIPTYKLNRFFFLREKEDTLVVVDLNGKTNNITERIFDKSCKKIKLAQSDHKIKLSQNNKYVYSILRELEGYDDYTPIRWIKIANKIRSVKFEDFIF